MNRTTVYAGIDPLNKICVNIAELCAILGCGKATANRIANEAGAKIYIGKRVIYSVDKIKNYIMDNAV